MTLYRLIKTNNDGTIEYYKCGDYWPRFTDREIYAKAFVSEKKATSKAKTILKYHLLKVNNYKSAQENPLIGVSMQVCELTELETKELAI